MARTGIRLGVALTSLLALVACATQPFGPYTAAPEVSAPAIGTDQDFLNRAMTGTGTQIMLGQLARERGAAPAIRSFGAHIAAEHERAHANLTALARRLAMLPSPATPDLSRLLALTGPEFDRLFIADQVIDQREALGLFDGEAQTGRNPQLRRFARERLPMLRRDLSRAEALAAELGV